MSRPYQHLLDCEPGELDDCPPLASGLGLLDSGIADELSNAFAQDLRDKLTHGVEGD